MQGKKRRTKTPPKSSAVFSNTQSSPATQIGNALGQVVSSASQVGFDFGKTPLVSKPAKPINASFGNRANDAFSPFFDHENIKNEKTVAIDPMVKEILGLEGNPEVTARVIKELKITIKDRFAGNISGLLAMLYKMKTILIANPVFKKELSDPIMVRWGVDPHKKQRVKKKELLKLTEYDIVIERIQSYINAFKILARRMSHGGKNKKFIQNRQSNVVKDKKEAMRIKLISIALSQVGKVFGMGNKKLLDPKNKNNRIGYERLQEYYAVASNNPEYLYGGLANKVKIKAGKKIKVNGKEIVDNSPSKEEFLSAWCGVFLFWVHRAAGLNIGNWDGSTVRAANEMSGFKRVLPHKPNMIRPGDVGIWHKATHHFMVINVDVHKDEIITIDGNTGGMGDLFDGQVRFLPGKRKFSETLSFYRHESLF